METTTEATAPQYKHVIGEFYSRPLKGKQQKNLIRLAQRLETAQESDMLVMVEGLTEGLCQILCLKTDDGYTDCTVADIDEAFSIEDQQQILSDMTGLSPKAATAPTPTSGSSDTAVTSGEEEPVCELPDLPATSETVEHACERPTEWKEHYHE